MTTREILIDAGGSDRQYWRDLWHYRELLFFLAWRDIKVRYKQTAIGIAWALLRPLLMIAVLATVFGLIARLPSDGVPYPLLVCSAILPWQLFAEALAESSNSLFVNERLISRVYFPRLLVPLSTIAVSVVDFAFSLLILITLMACYGFTPTWRVALLPAFVALAVAAAGGMGILMAALNVRFRDFRYVVPFFIQFGLYISPVGYSTAIIPDDFRLLYSVNPMVGVIDGFRWALLGESVGFSLGGFCVSLLITAAILVGGIWHFRSTEQTMVDTL